LKKIQKIREPILPPLTDSRCRNNKDLFIGGDLSGAVFILAAVREAGGRTSSAASRSSKEARLTPHATTIPKKPSRSEAMTSDQMNSDRTHQKEKTFLHCGVLRKRIKLWGERRLPYTPDQRASPLSYTSYMEGGSDSLERSTS